MSGQSAAVATGAPARVAGAGAPSLAHLPVTLYVVTPLAAAEIGSVELAWFSFGVGVVFWLGLLPLLLQRVLVHETVLPGKLLPTAAIVIAPPAVAMLSWAALTGDVGDPVARVPWAAAMAFVLALYVLVMTLRAVARRQVCLPE